MTSVSDDLGDRLISPNTTGIDRALWVPLLRLLATGEPVELGDLAQAAGRTLEQTRQALAATPETEYDQRGRIIGQGLTLRPTRHRFTLDGDELYTWCALDTLIFPALLERSATIESTSPTSGSTIRVTANPTGVAGWSGGDVDPLRQSMATALTVARAANGADLLSTTPPAPRSPPRGRLPAPTPAVDAPASVAAR